MAVSVLVWLVVLVLVAGEVRRPAGEANGVVTPETGVYPGRVEMAPQMNLLRSIVRFGQFEWVLREPAGCEAEPSLTVTIAEKEEVPANRMVKRCLAHAHPHMGTSILCDRYYLIRSIRIAGVDRLSCRAHEFWLV